MRRNHRMRRIAIFLLLWLMAGPAIAEIEEQVDVGIMEVWVKVTDKKGQAIRDLTENDFQLYIDKERVGLRCFDKSFNDPNTGIEDDSGRKYVFFFDMFNTLPGDMDFLKINITRFL